jgi:hypothetical protein
MARLFENDQNGQRESLANLMINAEVASTPVFSSLRKNSEMIQVNHTEYMKKYKRGGHKGSVDGKDVDSFSTNKGAPSEIVAQIFTDGTGVSTLANKAKIVKDQNAPGTTEMAVQIADSLVAVKFMIEGRIMSNEECQLDDGTVGNETRGMFKWGLATAQALKPVPAAYRPPSACYYASTLAAMTEAAFITMCQASFQQRKGKKDMKGYLGIAFKQKINDWQRYIPDQSGSTIISSYDAGSSKSNVLQRMVDILNMDTGRIDLEVHAMICTDATTGEDTAYTTRSGVFIDPAMYSWGFNESVMWNALEDKGGGPRGFSRAVGALICSNPTGQMTALIGS